MSKVNTVWVVDGDFATRRLLRLALTEVGFQTRLFDSAMALDEQLVAVCPDVIVVDIHTPGFDGFKQLTRLNREYPLVPIIATTARSNLESAVASYQSGAFEFLPKPFAVDEMVMLIQQALAHAGDRRRAGGGSQPVDSSAEIIGEAPAMQEVFRAIGRLAHASITVLINGESGTGKELVARALHRHSPRAERPFVALNMAAIPRELMESELFGHEKGSFTGALQQRSGRFEQANGGTLFLDEIGDMPLETQTRLLRVLAAGEFYRVGGHTLVKVDVRIIAATHQNLAQLVREQKFREDLYHRLNVIRVHVPSLTQRREDIPMLMRHFLRAIAVELDVEAKLLLPETAAHLTELDWPGNVRQLENTCRWLTVMTAGRELRIQDLPPELQPDDGGRAARMIAAKEWQRSLRRWLDCELNSGRQNIQEAILPVVERIMIETALAHSSGHRGEAAMLLGWGRNTLPRKIKQFAAAGG